MKASVVSKGIVYQDAQRLLAEGLSLDEATALFQSAFGRAAMALYTRKAAAARAIGIHRNTLRRLVKESKP